jgi:hypothetical protein
MSATFTFAKLGLMVVLLLAACAPAGKSRQVRIGDPLSDGYLQIVSVAPTLVEVDASGNIVKAAAPDGFCIPIDSIQTSPAAVFLVMDDCAGAAEGGAVSLSISNGPMTGGLDLMEQFLTSPPALIGLGYGGEQEDLSLIGISRHQGALIALIEDRSEFGPAFAGDMIGRAFLELNGRMTVLTILTRRDAPPSEAQLRSRIAGMVTELTRLNPNVS